MRYLVLLGAAIAALASPEAVRAQACDVLNGVDYRFERRTAVREVNDAEDSGRIELAVFVYRPLRNDRHTVVLFSHGSINGLTVDPREPVSVNCSLKDFFLSRGYTLVVPFRRGRGESTGTYVEECGRRFDPNCTPERNRLMTPRALDEAMQDSLAALDQVVLAELATPGSQVVLTGLSRGGFLSLAIAAARPHQVAAVINFAGGWLGFQPDLVDADETRLRLELHEARLRDYAARFHGPTLWLYAPNDPFYTEALSRRLHSAWRQGGGQGDYVGVPAVEPWRHNLLGQPELWAAQVDALLDAAAPRGGPERPPARRPVD